MAGPKLWKTLGTMYKKRALSEAGPPVYHRLPSLLTVPTRPRRRKLGKLADTPAGYVERQATARPRSLHPYTPQLRVLSWNVNGIRAQMEKEEGREVSTTVYAAIHRLFCGLGD